MADLYKNFAKLSDANKYGTDYSIEYIDRGSPVLIMAPHGGGIEPGTTPTARKIAEDDYSFYTFKGMRKKGNFDLHITSTSFDEPTALEAVSKAEKAVAVHGVKGLPQFIHVGGLDSVLRDKIARALMDSGFTLEEPPGGLGGMHPRNIVNRTRSGAGVQLELSKGLRSALVEQVLSDFALAIRNAVSAVLKQHES